jgi:hypothetical protein
MNNILADRILADLIQQLDVDLREQHNNGRGPER